MELCCGGGAVCSGECCVGGRVSISTDSLHTRGGAAAGGSMDEGGSRWEWTEGATVGMGGAGQVKGGAGCSCGFWGKGGCWGT